MRIGQPGLLLSAMNELNVNLQHSILTLAGNGWSNRRIARELGINRETVGKYLLLARPKPAISTPGSEPDPNSKPAIPISGSEPSLGFKTSHFDRRVSRRSPESLPAAFDLRLKRRWRWG